MSPKRSLCALTVLNLVVLTLFIARPERVTADAVAPVLRGRALELLDEAGHVRAEIKVLPAQPQLKMTDGTTGYPETVQLRLFSSTGGPHVKLAATEDGGALVIGGEPGYVQVLSRGTTTFVKIVDGKQKEQLLKP